MEITRLRKSKLAIELTPLIDVVFQLLIFFMLASSFSHPAIQMNLPKVKTQDEQSKEMVVISITKDQDIAINGFETSMEHFLDDVKLRLDESEHSSVHIQGDQHVPYGMFLQVVDLARQAGATHVNLVHDEVQ